jgi:hypothetical protein
MQMELSAQLERLESLRECTLCAPTYEDEYYFGYITGCVCITCGVYLDLANLEYHLPKPE